MLEFEFREVPIGLVLYHSRILRFLLAIFWKTDAKKSLLRFTSYLIREVFRGEMWLDVYQVLLSEFSFEGALLRSFNLLNNLDPFIVDESIKTAFLEWKLLIQEVQIPAHLGTDRALIWLILKPAVIVKETCYRAVAIEGVIVFGGSIEFDLLFELLEDGGPLVEEKLLKNKLYSLVSFSGYVDVPISVELTVA